MGFEQIKERRSQLISTYKPGTPFRESLITGALLSFIYTMCRGDIATQNALLGEVSPLRHRGKGGKRPSHASGNYVASDIRASRRRRNISARASKR